MKSHWGPSKIAGANRHFSACLQDINISSGSIINDQQTFEPTKFSLNAEPVDDPDFQLGISCLQLSQQWNCHRPLWPPFVVLSTFLRKQALDGSDQLFCQWSTAEKRDVHQMLMTSKQMRRTQWLSLVNLREVGAGCRKGIAVVEATLKHRHRKVQKSAAVNAVATADAPRVILSKMKG